MSKLLSLSYRLFESLLIKSWWVIVFMILCFFLYEQGLIKRDHNYSTLQKQYKELLRKKKLILAEQEILNLQINSQSDPEYVELTLMKGLGLVPEGSVKVLFTDSPNMPK